MPIRRPWARFREKNESYEGVNLHPNRCEYAQEMFQPSDSAANGTEGNDERRLILRTVRQFVEREVIPVASAMEHRGEYPHALADQMQKMGLFGLNTPEEFGGAEVDYVTFARIFPELARGWQGLAGIGATP